MVLLPLLAAPFIEPIITTHAIIAVAIFVFFVVVDAILVVFWLRCAQH